MELVDGTTLARVLDDGPLDRQRTAAIGTQLAGALAYVHERGVVHRDIKPANVLMGGRGCDVAKLTDFGVARLIDSTRLTVHGTTLGTANYLSPEQTTGGDVGPASDVYSLALVLLECLTGQVAYPGYGVEAALARLHRPPTVPAWLDPAWRDLLAAMTAFDAADRPGAAEVAGRLGALTALGRRRRTDHDDRSADARPRRCAAASAQGRVAFGRRGGGGRRGDDRGGDQQRHRRSGGCGRRHHRLSACGGPTRSRSALARVTCAVRAAPGCHDGGSPQRGPRFPRRPASLVAGARSPRGSARKRRDR